MHKNIKNCNGSNKKQKNVPYFEYICLRRWLLAQGSSYKLIEKSYKINIFEEKNVRVVLVLDWV